MVQGFIEIIMLALGFHIGWKNFTLITSGIRTAGTIISYKETHIRNTNTRNTTIIDATWLPVIQFRAGNHVITFTDYVGTSITDGINHSVPVLYDAATPTTALIYRPIMNWRPWAPIFALGAFLVAVALKRYVNSSSLNTGR